MVFNILINALSEHRSLALTDERARAVCVQVGRVVNGWRAHFAAQGVSGRDLAQLADEIDRPFLRRQR